MDRGSIPVSFISKKKKNTPVSGESLHIALLTFAIDPSAN
jgi:hypothetical protein